MPQTNPDEITPLPYATPTKRSSDIAAWLVALSLGAISGYLLSFAGFGAAGVAILAGVVIGTASAIAAEHHKFLPGLAGDAVATMVGLSLGRINNARAGIPNDYRELVVVVLVVYMFLAVPTLVCAGLLWLARRPAA